MIIKQHLISAIFLFPAIAAAEPAVLHFDGNDGLSDNYVLSIAQDRNGFVWIATDDGLNRFDGTSFRSFESGELGLAADELHRIVADPQENALWICTQRAGLDRLDCDTYTVTHFADGTGEHDLASNGITDVTFTPDGMVWVATYTSGLDRLDPATGKVIHYNSSTVEGWPDNQLWSAVAAPDGKLYLGHVDAGFSVFDPAAGTIKNYRNSPDEPTSLPGNQVRTVLADAHGNIWAGTNRGLALFNASQGSFTTFRHNPDRKGSLVSDYIYHLFNSSDDCLWIATENGGVSTISLRDTFLRTPEQISFTNYTATPSDGIFLSNKTVHVTFEDSFGNIWIGTHGDGVDVISHRPRPVAHRHTASYAGPLSDNSVMAVCVAGDTVYAGTDGAGIDVFAGKRKIRTLRRPGTPLRDNAVVALMHSAHGDIWIGTYGGDIAVLHPDGSLSRHDIPGVTDVRCFAEKADGTVLAGTGPGIVAISPDGKASALFNERDDIHEEWVRSIAELPDGNIWVGSFGYGISIFDKDFRFIKKLSVTCGLLSNTINHLLVRSDGKVWAATGNGLALISADGTIDTVITTADGLPDKAVKALATDKRGRLWMSTGEGISMLDKELKLNNYGRGHGIAHADFYNGSGASKGDTILFGSHRGLYTFCATTLTDTVALPAPRITGVTVYGSGGKPDKVFHVPADRLTLSHSDNTLMVNFGVPDAATASAMEWKYRVEGADNRLYPASPDDGILLRGMAPGSYRLEIRASMPNHQEYVAATLPFEIRPPLWASMPAKILYFIAVAAALFFGLRFYKKRLDLEYALESERNNSRRENELHAERMRFFTNITHELRTPLTLILGPLEDLKSDSTLSRSHSAMIAMIHKSASKLLELINTILEFRKTETQNRTLKVSYSDLAELVRETGTRYRSLNTNRDVDIRTEIEDGDFSLWFAPDIVTMIVDNLMSNACKYTVTGSVVLRLSHTTESGVPFTEISVRDTGLGMDSDTLSHIFDRYYRNSNTAGRLGTGIGLALVYNLVELHRGEIFVESVPGQGSVFRFRLHTDNTYPDIPHTTAAASEAESRQPVPEAETPTARPTVLVVDDNIDILSYIKSTLADTYTVETATDGADGLAKAHALMPDLIVSDVMMPAMSGTDMISRLKQSDDTSHIPVVVVTAKIAEEARLEAYECGADSFITKPFSSKLLKARIKNIINTRRRLARMALEAQLPAAPDSTTTAVENTAPEQHSDEIVSGLTAADSDFLHKVGGIINANIAGEQLDVGFIADAMCMSHSTLYRKVKAISGMSVAGLIRKYRARKAAELLLTGEYTVSEIALMVGMGSPANFRQCFREEFGTTPSEYFRRSKEK